MLTSIHPLGERGRNTSYRITVVSYIVGSLLGGLAIGSAMGGLGNALTSAVTLSPTTLAVIVLVVALGGVALDLGVGNLSVPSYQRQVNEDWLNRYRGWVYGSGFGFQLGLGVVTIVPTASIYAVFILAVLSGSLASGALIGLTFGGIRSAMILMTARATTPQSLRVSHRRIAATKPYAQRLVIGAQGGLAALMVGVLIWL